MPSVGKSTFYNYTNMIMTQIVLNILHSITRKIKSCHATMWQLCITIDYNMIVAMSDFLPFVKPTEYHRNKKELSDNGVKAWKVVDDAYNKTCNKKDDAKTKEKIDSAPILPNLISSTDETVIFATPNKIHSKENFILLLILKRQKIMKLSAGNKMII